MTFYVTIVLPLLQCPSCHMWGEGARRPITRDVWGEKTKTEVIDRAPSEVTRQKEMRDFCFDLCRWTSFSPLRLIHQGLCEHSAPALRNSEPFVTTKGWPKEEHLSQKHARVASYWWQKAGSSRNRLMTGLSILSVWRDKNPKSDLGFKSLLKCGGWEKKTQQKTKT